MKAQAMLIEGHSQREVGRTLHMSAHTVAKVIKTEDFVDHIKQMQERLFAIAPDTLASFHAQVKLDGQVWTARPLNENDVYQPGDHVTVVHIDGATAVVSKIV